MIIRQDIDPHRTKNTSTTVGSLIRGHEHQETPADLFATASYVELLDSLVKAALTFVHAVKLLRRGEMCKCARASLLVWTAYTVTGNISFQRATKLMN